MKILIIHFGELADRRKKCIESVERFYPDEEYIRIDESNYSLFIDIITSEYFSGIPQSRFNITHPKGRVIVADWLQMWFSSKLPDLMSIDTDCEILKRPEFSNKKYPYFSHIGTRFDYCWTYSNECQYIFHHLMKRQVFQKNRPDVFNDAMGIELYQPIDNSFFCHWSYEPGRGGEKHWQEKYFNW